MIGAQSTLTSYASGIQRKQWLLKHEGYLQQDQYLSSQLAGQLASCKFATILFICIKYADYFDNLVGFALLAVVIRC
jgi:hypothetical protein